MKVEIIVDPSRIPPPPLTTRVGPAPKAPKTPAAAAAARSAVLLVNRLLRIELIHLRG